MTEISLALGANLERAKPGNRFLNDNRSCWNFAAYLCLAGCVSFAVVGLFLSGINYFIAPGGTGAKIGTALVCAAFPLMLFGSHALDKIAECGKNK